MYLWHSFWFLHSKLCYCQVELALEGSERHLICGRCSALLTQRTRRLPRKSINLSDTYQWPWSVTALHVLLNFSSPCYTKNRHTVAASRLVVDIVLVMFVYPVIFETTNWLPFIGYSSSPSIFIPIYWRVSSGKKFRLLLLPARHKKVYTKTAVTQCNLQAAGRMRRYSSFVNECNIKRSLVWPAIRIRRKMQKASA